MEKILEKSGKSGNHDLARFTICTFSSDYLVEVESQVILMKNVEVV